MTETAIRQNPGVINLIMDGLQEYLDEAPELKDELPARAVAGHRRPGRLRPLAGDRSAAAVEGRLPPGRGQVAKRSCSYSLTSDLTPEEILASAERDLVATREQMYDVALPLYRDYLRRPRRRRPPRQGRASSAGCWRGWPTTGPTNETIVPEAREGLKKITEVRARRRSWSTVPNDPVEIIVMPEHQRGFAIGYCDSPGPLEKNGTTFYAISPTPKDWTAERAETFYREYNDYMLENLTIHEAMPGHYLQIAHANKYEAARRCARSSPAAPSSRAGPPTPSS